MNIKVINAGNCMICGKPIKLKDTKDTDKLPNIFFCPECEKKAKTGHCKDCKLRKNSDEVFQRGVSMESLCASCYVRNK